MPATTYVVREAKFNGQTLARPFTFTLHGDPAEATRASLIAEHPFCEGQSGSLEIVGTRDATIWRIRLSQVRVTGATATASDFDLPAPPQLEQLGTLTDSGLAPSPT